MTPYIDLLNEVVIQYNNKIFFDKESKRPMWVLSINGNEKIGRLQIIEGSLMPAIVSFDFIYDSEESLEKAAKELCVTLLLERLESVSKLRVVA